MAQQKLTLIKRSY